MKNKETSKTSKKKALTRPDVFKEFVVWISIPEPFRELKKQGEFAKKYEVSEKTLSTWKQRNDFWEAVEVEWRKWGKEKTSNVIAKFYNRIMTEGIPADFKLWLQYFLNWQEKVEAKVGGEITIVHKYFTKKDE